MNKLPDEPIAMILREELARVRNPSLADLEQYRGTDWWQLSDAEIAVFEIEPDRWPTFVSVYCAYRAFANVTDRFNFGNDIDARLSRQDVQAILEPARTAHPTWGITPETCSSDGFALFAQHYAGLTFRDADRCWQKMFWSDVRSGVIVYRGE
ncbi:hypothetical protein AB4156_32385 [Cupriavidus sp. 2MCAB6]|uniref:hypothetical protein n=1 Tax=Cupriavidus sp. 2MCAB6 TaxID=3232981 RepID=UPI003F91C94B